MYCSVWILFSMTVQYSIHHVSILSQTADIFVSSLPLLLSFLGLCCFNESAFFFVGARRMNMCVCVYTRRHVESTDSIHFSIHFLRYRCRSFTNSPIQQTDKYSRVDRTILTSRMFSVKCRECEFSCLLEMNSFASNNYCRFPACFHEFVHFQTNSNSHSSCF